MLKTIADSEADAGVHIKGIGTGGLSLRSALQKSNPLETQPPPWDFIGLQNAGNDRVKEYI